MELESRTDAVALLGRVLGFRDRYENVVQKLNQLHQQAAEVLTLKESKERTLGKEMCPNVAKMVCLDFERFKTLLSKMDPARGVTPDTQAILIGFAQQKLTAMKHNLLQDSVPPLLLTMPEGLLYDSLGPLVGTEALIGGLARAHSSFLGPSHDPHMHTTITFTADRAINLTEGQLQAWRPWVAKTKRAVVRCQMTDGMAKLIEGTRNRLESLVADTTSTVRHRVAPVNEGESGAAFPRLKTVVVGGSWASVSWRRKWRLRSLAAVELRKRSMQEETADDNEPGDHDEDETYGRAWLEWCDSPPNVILSPPFAWDACEAMDLVMPSPVKKVTSFKITTNLPDSDPWMDLDNFTWLRSVGAIEAAINVKQITPPIIHSLSVVHRCCVHPDGEEDYSSSSFDFPFTLLMQPNRSMRLIYDMEAYSLASSTLTLVASLATSVTFPTSLSQDAILQAFYSMLPKLVFSSARTLTLQPARDTDSPLPQPLLFNLGRVFPKVRCIDLGKAEQLGEEAVTTAIDHLPSLQLIYIYISAQLLE